MTTKPSGKPLGPAGAALRARLDLELGGGGLVWDHRELEILDQACAAADTIDQLEQLVARDGLVAIGSRRQPRVHPAVSEIRAQRTLLARLLGSLKLPSDSVRSARKPRSTFVRSVRGGLDGA